MRKNHVLHDLHLAFIGAGAMGEAMIGGLLSRHQLEPGHITASDRHRERLLEVQHKFHIHTTQDNRTAARKGQVVVLAVKPQVLPAVFDDLRGKIRKDAWSYRSWPAPRLIHSRPGFSTARSFGPCRIHPRRWVKA